MPAQVYLDQVQNAYIAYYGRPADPAGQNYWASQLEIVGGNLTALVNQFGNSDEFNAFAAGKTNAELINQLYINLFNRSADSAGLNWYADEVLAGRKTIATIALDVLNGATGVDTATLAAKFQAANAFSAALDTPSEVASYNANSLTSVKDWLKSITTPTESTQAVANINTNLPTILLIQTPTTAPTEAPTTAPTEAPTTAPTEAPTTAPTEAPTTAPTEAPTTAPTEGANVTISGAGTKDTTAGADIFKMAAPTSNYEVTINGGFNYAADKILVPTGSSNPSSIAGGVNNLYDGNVDLTWSSGGNLVTIHLIGLDPTSEAAIQANAVSSMVYGAY